MSDAHRCLSALYSADGLPADRDGDGLPDALRARLVPGSGAALPEHLALVDVAARLGSESMALEFPLVVHAPDSLPAEAVPIFIGRPATLSPDCPPRLRDALTALRAGEGLVALEAGAAPALLVGGADVAGLTDVARVFSAYLPYLRPEDASQLSLSDVRAALRAAAGAEMMLAVEALLTRGGAVAELRIGASVAGSDVAVVARALSLLSGAAPFPCDVVVSLDGGAGAPTIVRIAGHAQVEGQQPRADTRPLPDAPLPRSLAGLYGPGGVAVDGDGDLLPETPRVRLLLPDDLAPPEAAAAADLGARLGLESLGLALPLAYAVGAAPAAPGSVDIRIAPLRVATDQGLEPGVGELRLLEQDGGCVLEVRGDAAGRALALRELARLDPFDAPDGVPSLDAVQQALERLCALADQPAWACAALAAVEELPELAVADGIEPLALQVALEGLSPHSESDWPGAAAGSPSSQSNSVRTPALLSETREALERCIAGRIQQRTHGPAPDVSVTAAAGTTILDETHRLTWEVDDAWAVVETEVLPALAALPLERRDWLLDVRLSEPQGRRRQIKGELAQRLRVAGLAVADDQVRVLPAYWQGRAWLLEEVAPRLIGRDVAQVLVRVQRFARDYPCLELPIRWLQDLHLVDELLGQQLGLPHSAVSFELTDQENTYMVEARDAAGDLIWSGSFDVVHGQRPYLEGFPAWGAVHPPTGCVRLLTGGAPVVDARVAPDTERVWDLVRTALLPRLRAHVLAVTGGTPRPDDQPFFDNLVVEAWLSEQDEALGLREERVSPLESLHEDVYFMLLDYCSALLAAADAAEPYRPPWVRPPDEREPRRGARLWTAPGRVTPLIHRADGAAGRVRLRLVAVPERRPRLLWWRGTESGAVPLRDAAGIAARVVGLRLTPGSGEGGPSRHLLVDLDGSPEDRAQAARLLGAWAELRTAGALRDEVIPATWSLTVRAGAGEALRVAAAPSSGRAEGEQASERVEGEQESGLPREPDANGDDGARWDLRPDNDRRAVSPGAVTGSYGFQPDSVQTMGDDLGALVPWDRVLGTDDVERVLRDLAASPNVRGYRAGRSARGRPSYAVELTTPRRAGMWSRAKMSGWKATLLLNARHHANEPSSTSALLRLAALLAGDAAWRRYLDRVNVVLIPCENPDGAALHDQLQAEHPAWMLHAGRYNDAGLEFVSEYSNPNTRHTEALVLPGLWRRWVPDVVCDDHGFPSHEWVQPFAGHSNPWFRSHWISQGLIYLILPRIANPRYAQHGAALEELRRRLVRILADDPEVRARNAAFADRYRTFLSDRMPEMFPADFQEDVLVHVIDYDPDDPARARGGLAGLPGAHPGVTTASLITEVADETAQGRYMALCAHTHLLADRALLEYLYDADAPATIRRERHLLPAGRILLRATRPRPLLPGGGRP